MRDCLSNVWMDDVRPAPTNGWIWLKSVEATIEFLRTNPVGKLSLDHDMGEGPTGMEVLKYLTESARNGLPMPNSIYIHSQNPVAATNMRWALKDIYEIQASKHWEEKLNDSIDP